MNITLQMVLVFSFAYMVSAHLRATHTVLALNQALQELVTQHVAPDQQKLTWWMEQVRMLPVQLSSVSRWASSVPLEEYVQHVTRVRDLLHTEHIRTDIDTQGNHHVEAPKGASYAQKKIIAGEGPLLYWIADLRGDIHTLVSILACLHNGEKVLDNDFVLAKNSSLLFTGNYVDLGTYGVEVLYLLSLLKQKNPDKVFLVRGRHETEGMNVQPYSARGGFFDELAHKFPEAGQEKLRTLHEEFYGYIPVTLYVGVTHGAHTNYLQCVSSGLEFYNPAQLLAGAEHNATQVITSVGGEVLYQEVKAVFKKFMVAEGKLQEVVLDDTLRNQDNLFGGLPERSINPRKARAFSVSNANFMWSNFNDMLGAKRNMTQLNVQTDSVIWGKFFIEALLRLPDPDAQRLTVVGLLCGYQNRLYVPQLFYPANQNIYKLSKGLGFEKSILMMVSTPTLGLPGRCFGKIAMGPAATPKDWTFTRIFSPCVENMTCSAWTQKQEPLTSFENPKEDVALCGSVMYPVWNSTGTCFLNAALQLWRVISCIPLVRSEMIVFYGSKFTSAPDREKNHAIFVAVQDFLQGYDKPYGSANAGAGQREALLKKVQSALEAQDSRLKEEAMFAGRTHLTMVLLQEALLTFPALITPDIVSSFKSSVGFVLNELDNKKSFDTAMQSRSLTDEQKKSIEKLQGAQHENNYIALPIARAIGLEAFLGEKSFNLPRILIISTTRKNPDTGNYEKARDRMAVRGERAGDMALMTIVPGSDAVKFTTHFSPQKYGFPALAPNYHLIGFSAKIPGHALAVVNFGGKWWSCSNQEVVVIPDGESVIEQAGKDGYLQHSYFGRLRKDTVVPEVLVYQRDEFVSA